MKTHERTKWMRTLGNFSYMLGVAFLIAAMAVNATPAPSAQAAVRINPNETPPVTKTPVNTSTPTTPAGTPTNTPTTNPSQTPTATPTNTPTTNPSQTPTATPTNTPTATRTNTPTATSTTTGEPGPSNTPTNTPTNTSTSTPTNTATTTGQPGGPSIETVLSATLLTLTEADPVQSVYDTATLSGVTSDAGGTVTYRVYSDNQCSVEYRNAGTVNVTNGIVPNSNLVDFDTPGTYYWQASYSGDANNESVVDECAAEILVVATPTTTTEPGPSPTPQPLIPVSGANLGNGGGLQAIFFNLGIAFLGLGLVLNGLARERKELDG